MAETPMIEAKNLSKHFRDHVAVDGLSFALMPGEILGFLGPNGAGKTTTMRMLTGAMPPTEGEVRIDGTDVFESPIEVKRRIGYLPELPPVYMDMTVRSYVEFCGRIKGIRGKALAAEADRVMTATDVKGVSDRLICNLSKGYRQRVGLAQAILGSPPVLILDEPTVGLDPVQIIEVRELIRSLAESRKHTIILSTHILHEVTELCGKILVIKRGKMIAFDTPENLNKQLNGGRNASLEETYLKLIEAPELSLAQAGGEKKSPETAPGGAEGNKAAAEEPPPAPAPGEKTDKAPPEVSAE